jgi:RimJ/RimL family protein N-acetyltransferase
LLEGKTVNLKVVEKDDLPLLIDWNSNSRFYGEYCPLQQFSKTEWEKRYDNLAADSKWFFIEKKNGTKIGEIGHNMLGKHLEIYYYLIHNERGRGYGTEAIMIMVDYLFLSKELMRVQATPDADNIVSQRVLEKAGFTREGTIRKNDFSRGKWVDGCLYSILREEWKEPKILRRTT